MTAYRSAAVAVAIVATGVAAPEGVRADGDREPAPATRPDACARGTRWRGSRIALDVVAAPVTEVLRYLADVGRVDVMPADDIAGTITLRLRAVPWDQALCAVAAAARLAVVRDDRVYLVQRR